MEYPKLTPVVASGATQPRYMSDHFADMLSVKDFGAKGNGSADDKTALQGISGATDTKSPKLFPVGLYKSSNDDGKLVSPKAYLKNTNIDGYAKADITRPIITHFLRDRPSFSCYGLNGAACDGTFLYYIINSDAYDTYQTVQKVNLSTGAVVATLQHSDLGHANSMTCDETYLYVAPGDADDPYIHKLSKTTLETVANIDISGTCVGGYCGCMGYNPDDGRFYLRNGKYVSVYNGSFSFITKFQIKVGGFDDISYNTHALCFFEGSMYGLVVGMLSAESRGDNLREFVNYIVKYNSDGQYEKAWQLDIMEEAESLTVYNGMFLIGLNSKATEQYDFFTVEFLQDRLYPASSINLIDKRAMDYDVGKRVDRYFYVQKDSSTKLVGSGKKTDPFTNLSEAIFEIKKLASRHEWNHFVVYVSGVFTDEFIILKDIPSFVTLSVESGNSATFGRVRVQNCKKIQIDSPINISLALSSASTIGLEVIDSVVRFGCSITATGSTTSTTYGVQASRSTVITGSACTITGFSQGVNLNQNSFLYSFSSNKITFTNCTENIVCRQGFVYVDSDILSDYIGGSDSYATINVANANFESLEVMNKRVSSGKRSYLKTWVNNSPSSGATHAAYIEAYFGNSRGARMLLTSPESGFSSPGSFTMQAYDGANTATLKGSPDGTLTWNGQPVSTTSDERLKTSLEIIPEEVFRAWGEVQWGQFKFLDAVSIKGDMARLHTGLIAQHVDAVFKRRGLDACAYGILCHEQWDDEFEEKVVVDEPEERDENGVITVEAKTHVEQKLVRKAGDVWQIRYEEALALECAYQRWRLAQLEERVNQLTSENS